MKFEGKVNNSVVSVGHTLKSFKYENDRKKIQNFETTITFSPRDYLPAGVEDNLAREFFGIAEEAETRLAILQTVSLLQMLAKPEVKCSTASVSFANAREREILEEMRKIGLELRITSICNRKSFYENEPFPYGRRAEEGENLTSLIDKEHGALYIACDHQIWYGGQTKNINGMYALHTQNDTVNSYQQTYGKVSKIPLASVPKNQLFKFEAHLHISLFIASLLRLKNPFRANLAKFHPYCLNKMTMTKHFDEHSWRLIQQFLLREFAVGVELVDIS